MKYTFSLSQDKDDSWLTHMYENDKLVRVVGYFSSMIRAKVEGDLWIESKYVEDKDEKY